MDIVLINNKFGILDGGIVSDPHSRDILAVGEDNAKIVSADMMVQLNDVQIRDLIECACAALSTSSRMITAECEDYHKMGEIVRDVYDEADRRGIEYIG